MDANPGSAGHNEPKVRMRSAADRKAEALSAPVKAVTWFVASMKSSIASWRVPLSRELFYE
jgi:hypothetical protein